MLTASSNKSVFDFGEVIEVIHLWSRELELFLDLCAWSFVL
jgi:hypothetical protein